MERKRPEYSCNNCKYAYCIFNKGYRIKHTTTEYGEKVTRYRIRSCPVLRERGRTELLNRNY